MAKLICRYPHVTNLSSQKCLILHGHSCSWRLETLVVDIIDLFFISTNLRITWHGIDRLCMVRVGPSGGGWVDVTHHTVACRHDGTQRLGELLLLLPVLRSAILEPNLQIYKYIDTIAYYPLSRHKMIFWGLKPLRLIQIWGHIQIFLTLVCLCKWGCRLILPSKVICSSYNF